MNNSLSPFSEFHHAIYARRKKLLFHRQNRRTLFSILRTVSLILIFILLFQIKFGFQIVDGTGMFPALADGDLALTYRQDQYIKNDVVFYVIDGKKHVGRVVAKGGDFVDYSENGTLIVNGTPQTGEIIYPTYPPASWQGTLYIPDNAVYILGDNRMNTQDSRTFGAVALDDVDAKIMFLIRHRKI